MSSVMTPPRPPAAKPTTNGNGAHAASKPNGNGAGSPGYSKQNAEQMRAMILAAVAKGEMTVDQAAAELRELVEVRTTGGGQLRFKVGPSGAISAYGLQRMPVSLYVEQWERVIGKPGDCSSPFALTFWDFVREWDGKDYHGESQGKAYTARIARKQR